MKLIDLDGNAYSLNLGPYGLINTKRPRSNLHLQARKLIKELYPTLTITEEVPVRIRRNQQLYLDFFIPLLNTAIEVHGEQHFKFNTLFHSAPGDFMQQKKNDIVKSNWCETNGIRLVVFPHFEEIEQWQNRLLMND